MNRKTNKQRATDMDNSLVVPEKMSGGEEVDKSKDSQICDDINKFNLGW